jgi:hypothetical protein
MYVFKSLEDMAAFFEMKAKELREELPNVPNKRNRKREEGIAFGFEYTANVLRTSHIESEDK